MCGWGIWCLLTAWDGWTVWVQCACGWMPGVSMCSAEQQMDVPNYSDVYSTCCFQDDKFLTYRPIATTSTAALLPQHQHVMVSLASICLILVFSQPIIHPAITLTHQLYHFSLLLSSLALISALTLVLLSIGPSSPSPQPLTQVAMLCCFLGQWTQVLLGKVGWDTAGLAVHVASCILGSGNNMFFCCEMLLTFSKEFTIGCTCCRNLTSLVLHIIINNWPLPAQSPLPNQGRESECGGFCS